MKTYLFVPYSEKDAAKKLGAKWDPIERKWYAPEGEEVLIKRWSIPPPITELIGEDRNFRGNQLFVDLVPRSCWFTNVRYCIEPKDWDRLRKFVYERAGNKCECCGIAGDADSPLAAHERWDFDLTKKTQRLMRIIALCEACHETTHMGFANINGRGNEATQHLMEVTGMAQLEADSHIKQAFDLWEQRNKIDWVLDLSIITNSGIMLIKKAETSQRREISEETLAGMTSRSLDKKAPLFAGGSSLFFVNSICIKREAPDDGFDEVSETKRQKHIEEKPK